MQEVGCDWMTKISGGTAEKHMLCAWDRKLSEEDIQMPLEEFVRSDTFADKILNLLNIMNDLDW